jgi:hypothetical protein
VRLSRCEVRDHINYRKNDRWRSHRFYRALQRLKSPMRYVCEIFGAPRFSSFSTQSDAKRTLDERRCQLPGAYDWAVATCGITSKKESRALLTFRRCAAAASRPDRTYRGWPSIREILATGASRDPRFRALQKLLQQLLPGARDDADVSLSLIVRELRGCCGPVKEMKSWRNNVC